MKNFMSKLLCYLMIFIMLAPQASEAAFTPNKQYNNQATGSNVNTWGITLNSNFTAIDSNLGGTLTTSVAGNSNVTLSSAQAQNLIYDFTGILTGNIVVFFPAQGGFYYVSNQTTGAFTLTVEATGASSGVLIPQGQSLPVYVDNSTSPPTVTTGYFALAGANANITSITGLTTPLSHAQGGTSVYTGGTTGGSANAQTLATTTPSGFALIAGNIVTGIAGFTNAGAATLNINSTGATAMRVATGSGLAALVGGEVVTGNSYVWLYDGAFYDLLNPSVIVSSNIPSSVALAGSPTTTTQSSSDNTTKIATTAFVQTVLGTPVKRVQRQTCTSNCTYTPCTGLIYGDYEIYGGGGGGGGAISGGNGAGGAAGGKARKIIASATIGGSQSVTIGGGGAGGSTSGGTGSTGGTSSLGALISATGGVGGAGQTSNTVSVAGGSGGVGSSGDINLTGAPGGGGGSANTANSGMSGYGGNTDLGGGGKANPNSSNTSNAATANTGSGGAGASSNSGGQAGGAGATGFFIATEYCSQ